MRPVHIEYNAKLKAYFVVYADRKPRGRYCAAQFDESMRDYAGVVEWIDANPKIFLQVKS